MSYLLDANVFIAAKRQHYGMDFCPGFWDWIIREHAAGKVFSVEKVGVELLGQGDDLSEWAGRLGEGFFLPATAETIPHLGSVSHWATSQRYQAAAINDFLQAADYYLVAQALASGFTVVTHEKPEDSRLRIKIPNACLGVGVKYLTPFQLLRLEHARFVLGGRP